MKVLFTGAQGTGKTSVMEVLPDMLPKIKGVTRKCIADNELEINMNSTDRSQKAIFDAYEQQFNSHNHFISERSLFDVYAFTTYQYYKGKCSQELLDEQRDKIKEFITNNPDSLYIYFPIEFEIQADGQRSTDKVYQEQIDMMIKNYLDTFGVHYITVHGTVEERVNQIIDNLSFSRA